MSNPFTTPASVPGQGQIHLALLPPATPRLRTIQYQYPLKLVSPAPIHVHSSRDADADADDAVHTVHTVYILTYGGGLVAGDTTQLSITQDATTRLVLLTQGTTKLFRAPPRTQANPVTSRQSTDVRLAPGAALCFLPDPVQPFAASCYEQTQRYHVPAVSSPSAAAVAIDGGAGGASLCALDWVCRGRAANGEDWSCQRYASRNEIFVYGSTSSEGKGSESAGRLLLRDNLTLDDGGDGMGERSVIAARMDGLGVVGTLILHGPLMRALGLFFMREFQLLPRVGAKKWDDDEDVADRQGDDGVARSRAARHAYEAAHRVLWSAASLRGCVVVKFGAPELEAARTWLCTMLLEEGSVVRYFGERALLCLR